LGRVFYNERKFDQAEKMLIQSLSIAPDFARSHFWLARTLVNLDEKEEALFHYQEASRLLPSSDQYARELKSFEASLQDK
jgi:tetratricopeptide (TPR) repeat protein